MSYLTSINRREVWQGDESTPLSTSHISHLQLPGSNPSSGLCSDIQDIVRHRPDGAKRSLQDEEQILRSTTDSTSKELGSFVQTIAPAVSSTSSSSDLNRASRGNSGSLSIESSSELSIPFTYLPQQGHAQPGNSSISNLAIPPTPSSIEMHGINSLSYTQPDCQQQKAVYETIQMQGNEQDIELTPLISPAVSPLEYQFNALGYSLAEAYLSPLSSPALQAQNEFPPLYEQRSWTTSSPILNANRFSSSEFPGSLVKNSNNRVSSIQSPNGFKLEKSPVLDQTSGIENTNTFPQTMSKTDLSYSHSSNFELNPYVSLNYDKTLEDGPSSLDKISSMTSILFTPHTSVNVPTNLNSANSKVTARNLTSNIPVTPASLMKISQPLSNSQKSEAVGGNQLSLGDSKDYNSPSLSSYSTLSETKVNLDTSTNLFECGTPSMQSPVTELKTGLSKKKNAKCENPRRVTSNLQKPQPGLRTSKKRNGTQNVVSPALLPRLSPNTRLILHSGRKELEGSASLLLASKSNYQNILDGTYFPGITYSSELSANLTSKRTSHKIAEQERRNRMNSALQEIATLLPRDQNKENVNDINGRGDRTDCEKPKGMSQSTSSKARTVEQAISYINYLKDQLEIANKKLEETESKKDS